MEKILQKGQNVKTNDLQTLAYEYLREMSKIKISKNHADVSGKNNPSANIYKIIKPNGDILYMCGNQIYNNPRKKNDKKGFLNISKDTFNKYIRPYGCVDVTKIKTKSVIEKLLPYNGWQFIKID